MATNTETEISYDLRTGFALRVIGVRVLDGISGWIIAEMADFSIWAYAPQDVFLNTGEICREI